jgi:hypothetical protein
MPEASLIGGAFDGARLRLSGRLPAAIALGDLDPHGDLMDEDGQLWSADVYTLQAGNRYVSYDRLGSVTDADTSRWATRDLLNRIRKKQAREQRGKT